MDKVRAAIVDTLKGKFPEMAQSIAPFTSLLNEQSDSGISYRAPGVLVSIISAQEAPENVAPWEVQGEFGLVVAVNESSASKRDVEGWKLCMKVASVVYRNTWGISGMYIRPAIITGMYKAERRNPDGTPSGLDYWVITFYNWLKFEALF
jgi:hypothetical protein